MKSILQRLQSIPDKLTSEPIERSFFHLYRTHAMSSAGLAIKAGGSAIVKNGSAFVAVVSGNLVYVAANTDTTALSGAVVTTAFKNIFLLTIDAAGTTAWLPGNQATTVGAIGIPVVPNSVAVVGSILVQNATGSDFTPGTTALDTGSLTVTYLNTVGPFYPVHSL